jgi:hypothetical protein
MVKDENSLMMIGWREWASLPHIHIPFIKAKVDTGAKTSALHAFDIYQFTERGMPKVHFSVHPLQRREDIVINCSADIIDRRVVSDSGGHRERRYVIQTPLVIGGVRWIIEMTLANRESMSFRMLLGRDAMKSILIEPTRSYLLGRPQGIIKSYKKKTQLRKK